MNRLMKWTAPGAVVFAATVGAMQLHAQEVTPPPPAPPRPMQIRTPVEQKLANGMRIVVFEKHSVPLVSAQLLVQPGSEADPENQGGTADFTASLLTKGTTTRTATQIAQAIEALGGTLQSRANWDASRVSLTVMSSKLLPALAIVSDVVRHPTFKADELQRLRAQRLDNLRVNLQDPGTLANVAAARVVYGDGPYAHPVSGTPESISRITRADIAGFHAKYYGPQNAVLVLAGDITPAAALKIAQQLFGDWKRSSATAAENDMRPVQAGGTRRVVVIDMPEAGQAAVVMSQAGIPRNDPDYFVALVTNSVFGGGYSSRLNFETRIKRGLTYGAGSDFDTRRDAGPFSADGQTKNESAGEVASIFVDELKRLASDSVPQSELVPRKATLIGNFGRQLETSSGMASQAADLALYGIDASELTHYIDRVQAVNADQVKSFAATHIPADKADVIVVGDGSKFLDDLRKRFPDATIIPIKQLDLNSARLRKAGTS
jgi:zinc protease